MVRGKNLREFLQNKTKQKNSDGFILDINQTAEEIFFLNNAYHWSNGKCIYLFILTDALKDSAVQKVSL